MAEIIEDRVKQTSTSSGTGDFVLSGTPTGYKAFSSVCATGDTFHGCIVAVDASGVPTGEWETGQYTYKGSSTIERTTVRSSSATSNAKVVFSAGAKQVFLDLTAYQIKNFGTTNSQNPSVLPTVPTAEQAGYTAMTFQEDFSGSTLDTAKWNLGGWDAHSSNNATQNYSVAGGNLNIWPQRDAVSAWFDRSLTTRNKFSQQFGFFEFEFQAPIGAGCYVECGLSNDLHELFKVGHMYTGAPSGGWSNTSLQAVDAAFAAETDYTSSASTTVAFFRAKDVMTPPNFSTAFHTFGIRWDATTLKFYVDGVQRGATTSHTQFQDAMFMYLGLSLVSNNEYPPAAGSGTPSSSNAFTPEGSTNSLKINYARAWQIA